MLYATGNSAFMITADRRFAHFAAPIRVFATAFHNSAPTRVAGKVYHRRKSYVYTVVFRFGCGKFGAILDKRGIETARKSDRHGINRSVTVNYVQHYRKGIVNTLFLTRFAERLRRFSVRHV